MVFTARSVELPENKIFSSGPKSTFSEGMRAAYRDQRANNSMLGLHFEFKDADQKNLDKIYELTGERIEPYQLLGNYYQAAKYFEGKKEEFDPSAKLHSDRIDELKKKYPEIKTLNEVWSGVKDNARAIEDNLLDIDERGGFASTMGEFVGAVGGSFSERDPLNVATLPLAYGRTVAIRILSEIGINSSIELVNQVTGVNAGRELLGLDHGMKRVAQNVIYAGVGAGVLRGVGESAVPLIRVASGKLKKATSLTDKQLGEAIAKNGADTPTERGVRLLLESDEDVLSQNPLGEGHAARGEHLKSVRTATDDLNRSFEDPVDDAIRLSDDDLRFEVDDGDEGINSALKELAIDSDLDQEIPIGAMIDDANKVALETKTIREILEEVSDDDDLVMSMQRCLL